MQARSNTSMPKTISDTSLSKYLSEQYARFAEHIKDMDISNLIIAVLKFQKATTIEIADHLAMSNTCADTYQLLVGLEELAIQALREKNAEGSAPHGNPLAVDGVPAHDQARAGCAPAAAGDAAGVPIGSSSETTTKCTADGGPAGRAGSKYGVIGEPVNDDDS